MSLTLNVSKLSGWLNADAACQLNPGHTNRGEVQDGRWEGVGAVAVQARGAWGGTDLEAGVPKGTHRAHPKHDLHVPSAGEGSAANWEQGTRGGAHIEHVAHARDAGGVEAQRLVERIRILPRVERRAYGAGRGSGREAGGGGRPRCTQRAGEGSTAGWEQGMGKSARRTWRTCL